MTNLLYMANLGMCKSCRRWDKVGRQSRSWSDLTSFWKSFMLLPARGQHLKESSDFNVALNFDLDLESGQIVALIHTDLVSHVGGVYNCFFPSVLQTRRTPWPCASGATNWEVLVRLQCFFLPLSLLTINLCRFFDVQASKDKRTVIILSSDR